MNVVLAGARVRTLDAARPLATIVAAASGRIAYVGDDLPAARAAAPGADVIDLGGRVVTPGLADSHTHVATWARTRERLSLDGLTELEPVLARVREAHARLPAGEPLLGEDVAPFGLFAPAPSRAQLDLAAPGRRVILRGRDHHAAWASSAALAEAGVTRETEDPPGGRIGRDGRGEPDGLLFENALGLLDFGGELAEGALERALLAAAALGITCVHEFGDASVFAAYRALAQAGLLPVRVAYGEMPARGRPEDEPLAASADERLWVYAHKAFVDGTLGSRTAWMLEPFAGSADTGIPMLDAGALDRLGERARARDVTLALHAIGDAAVRAALDAFARWPAAERARLRPRIEHAQLVHPDDVGRFRALGVIASMQPAHSATDRALARKLWGERDARGGYAWRTLEQAGAVLALGSDAPIEPIDPRVGLWAATTGGSERELSFERALHGFTTGAAWAVRREHDLGRIAPGFLADFTVWGADPWETPPARLRALAIEQTWVGGRRVV